MAQHSLVNGTSYEIVKCKTLVDGTEHRIMKGRTLVDGTGYDILFPKFRIIPAEPIKLTVYDNSDYAEPAFQVTASYELDVVNGNFTLINPDRNFHITNEEYLSQTNHSTSIYSYGVPSEMVGMYFYLPDTKKYYQVQSSSYLTITYNYHDTPGVGREWQWNFTFYNLGVAEII